MPISADYQDALIVVLETGDLPAHDRTQAVLDSGLVFRIKMRARRKEMPESMQSPRTAILSAPFCGYEGPAFAIRLWDGWRWSSSKSEKPVCTMVVENPQAFQSLVADPY